MYLCYSHSLGLTKCRPCSNNIGKNAHRTAGANPIVGVDINRYLLQEAAALVQRAGLADRISFQEGSAEALPLAADSVDIALSCAVMEEGGG